MNPQKRTGLPLNCPAPKKIGLPFNFPHPKENWFAPQLAPNIGA